MNQSQNHLPDHRAISDAELQSWSNQEYADWVIERAAIFGTIIMDKKNYRLHRQNSTNRSRNLVDWNLKHAWLEWWNGVTPPAKEIILLGEVDTDLKIRLAQQIIDEVKHQKVFSNRVNQMGGDGRIDLYEPVSTLRNMYDATFGFDDPLEIACSMQCTGEAVLLHHVQAEQSITYYVLDDETLEDIAKHVAPEEPRHVKNGRDLFIRYADSLRIRRRLFEVQDIKLKVLQDHYLEDHLLVGAEFIAPLPVS